MHECPTHAAQPALQANAYEADGGQRIVVDSIHYDSLPAVGREALAEQQVGVWLGWRAGAA